ncbi:MAG: hypothetical protein WCE69_14485, partial [Aestuariivirga sp.]
MAHPTTVAGLEQAIFNVNGSARLKSVRQANQAFLQNPEAAEFFIIYLSFQLHYARGKVCPLFQRIGLLVEAKQTWFDGCTSTASGPSLHIELLGNW